jgi:hypothetical protein
MGDTAFYAPLIVLPGKPALGNYSNNPDMAPASLWGGAGLMDPRYRYLTGNRKDGQSGVLAPQVLGFAQTSFIKTVGGIPSAVSTSNIAAAQNASANVPFSLVTTSGAGITVLSAPTLMLPSLVTAPTGAVALDGLLSFKKFGVGFQSWFYDPSTMIARAISITGVSGATGGNVLLTGLDLYGYPQTQLVTVAAGATTTNSLKCWKTLYAATPLFSDAHNYSIGTADIYDLGIEADQFADCDIYWAGVLQLLATYTAPVTTSPATNLTGAPRGVFTPGSSSDGTKRLDILVETTVGRLATVPMSVGLFGVTPA